MADGLTPLTRIEEFLAAIRDEYAVPAHYLTRIEQYLMAIASGNAAIAPAAPLTRIEQYLAAWAFNDITIAPSHPLTRIERYLAARVFNDASIAPPFPLTRIEGYLTIWTTYRDTEPYFIRRVTYGNREYDTLVGGTLCWNQLVEPVATSTERQGITVTRNADGSYTLSGEPTSANWFYNIDISKREQYLTMGHVYYLPKGTDRQNVGNYLAGSGSVRNTARSGSLIFKVEELGELSWLRLQISNSTGDYIDPVTIYPQLFDLTAMYGESIADYVLALEEAETGSGVSWIESQFGFKYYPYCEPELRSVSGVSAHIMRNSLGGLLGDYALDSSLTLRGVPKLDANNRLYYDGDEYKADGTVTRKYAQRAYQSGDESLADAITDGSLTVYKLETPTIEQATPFENPQIVAVGGTEEYVTDSIVPVGHDSEYYYALRGGNNS